MADSGSNTQSPHIALFPSSGMGHLTPFLRLAATLSKQNFQVTVITFHPTVSFAESKLLSSFFSAFPQITSKEFHLLPFDPSTVNSKDPFFLKFEAIRCSAPLLSPLLTSLSPPVSALITDITLASSFLPITSNLHLPNHILFTSSAKMLAFCSYYPSLVDTNTNSIKISEQFEIPGLSTIPKAWIPPLLLDLTNLFATQFLENGRKIIESNGVLINTFNSLEPESLKALNEGKVIKGLPPIIPIGPLVPCDFEKGSPLKWLDDQPEGSVVYVSFGSRTAMSRVQIRELGVGLVKSGCRFVWVVKDSKVDKEDEEDLEVILGKGYVEEVKNKGLVMKGWVDQEEVLSHQAVSGFVSHCGWNSVSEAAWHGVRMLAWPQHGDQMINADVVRKSGLGMWVESWIGGNLVKGEEIGEKIKELMEDEGLRLKTTHVREEARKAVGIGGSSEVGLLKLRKNLEPI
ncbi:Udp-glycosyltransferase [Thalictrum thalictroides]|uniref:Glycosyltransferase n=1 Tax=Thalictrum thalictroides TaxID=46969 RepID=A0A7J6X2I8_THATH|nr:Udp-glycosyltransferase [Thalictrum thalictroides]